LDRFIKRYAVRQIARRNRISSWTVLSRIVNAKRHLRQAWAADLTVAIP
jgi:hypothetical protein